MIRKFVYSFKTFILNYLIKLKSNSKALEEQSDNETHEATMTDDNNILQLSLNNKTMLGNSLLVTITRYCYFFMRIIVILMIKKYINDINNNNKTIIISSDGFKAIH